MLFQEILSTRQDLNQIHELNILLPRHIELFTHHREILSHQIKFRQLFNLKTHVRLEEYNSLKNW